MDDPNPHGPDPLLEDDGASLLPFPAAEGDPNPEIPEGSDPFVQDRDRELLLFPFPVVEEDPNPEGSEGPDPSVQERHLEFLESAPFAPRRLAGKLQVVRPPPTPVNFAAGNSTLLPFASPPFAPGGVTGKLNAVRPPPTPVSFNNPMAAGDFTLLPFASPPFSPREVTGKLNAVRPPPTPVNFNNPMAAGDFTLLPFASPPFSPREVTGKLNAVRPPPLPFIPPATGDGDGSKTPPFSPIGVAGKLGVVCPPVLGDVVGAGPTVLDAAVDLEPGFLQTGINAPPSNVVVEPQLNDVVLPNVAAAGSLNVDAVGIPFVRRLYEFLMSCMEDESSAASVMAWIDDFTFQVLNPEFLLPQFGKDLQMLDYECRRHGIVQVAAGVWRHRQGYLRRGTPELLQAIQVELETTPNK